MYFIIQLFDFVISVTVKEILQKSIFILIFFVLGDRLFRPPYAISSLSVCLSVCPVCDIGVYIVAKRLDA